MTGHEDVQAGRVAAAHLEPIERRQRNLHGMERLDRTRLTDTAPEVLDRARRAQAVPAQRPQRVLDCDDCGVQGFDLDAGVVRVERGVEIDDDIRE